MKRLFLASSGLEYIKTFVGHNPADLRMLFIPTAGNLDDDIWWIDKDRDVLTKMGFDITECDIETTPFDTLKDYLAASDIVYVAGGNTFHLLKALHSSGFDELLTEFVSNGGLYAGASAGALIAGTDIVPVTTIDEPEKVHGLVSTKALQLVNIVPIPHYDMNSRTKTIDDIQVKYKDQFELVVITDDQAIVVEGDKWSVVESKRSELELEWFRDNHA